MPTSLASMQIHCFFSDRTGGRPAFYGIASKYVGDGVAGFAIARGTGQRVSTLCGGPNRGLSPDPGDEAASFRSPESSWGMESRVSGGTSREFSVNLFLKSLVYNQH